MGVSAGLVMESCVNKSPRNAALNTARLLPQFLRVRTWPSFTGPSLHFNALPWLLSRCHQGGVSSKGWTGEGSASTLMWLLAACSSSGLLAGGPSCPQYLANELRQHGQMLHQSQQRREFATKSEVAIFYNLIMRVTDHHLCHVLLVRSKSQGPGHT